LAARSTIGQVIAERLHSTGNKLALLGRDLTGLNTEVASFSANCELTDFDAVEEALGEAREALGGLTGLVNCSGSIVLKPAHLTSRKLFDETIEASLATAFAAVRSRSGGRKTHGQNGGFRRVDILRRSDARHA
jgi:NAD(P)-dependent dehydrogenase (short-subunit alcohol dehydrogenase family)